MLDTSAIGDLIASSMLELEERYPEGRVRSVVLVAEVDDGRQPSQWSVHGPDDRRWLTRVVLEMALGQLDVESLEVLDLSDED
jgi:phage/plasmid-associated DNA primase